MLSKLIPNLMRGGIGMVDIEFTQVRLQSTINTPFRVVTLFVSIVLAAIIAINAN